MEKSKILNILDFYLDSMDEDIELINEELKNANINVDESEKKIMEFLKNANAEVKIEKSRKLRLVFNDRNGEIKTKKDFENKSEDDIESKMEVRSISHLSENDINIANDNSDVWDLMEG